MEFTAKELSALEDQLYLEDLLVCKYREAAHQTGDLKLKSQLRNYAQQHRVSYLSLLNFLQDRRN